MTIISPWTRGGWVCFQVFDNTSVLRFLETRFQIPEPNTTVAGWGWIECGVRLAGVLVAARRAVFGGHALKSDVQRWEG